MFVVRPRLSITASQTILYKFIKKSRRNQGLIMLKKNISCYIRKTNINLIYKIISKYMYNFQVEQFLYRRKITKTIQTQIFFILLLYISLPHLFNNVWIPMEKNSAPGDHKFNLILSRSISLSRQCQVLFFINS